ncbi:MAG: hypothetical protein ACYS1A_03000 [Planctomycetota bacterium]|jgi:SAM-dependent methyltransferase
MNGTLRNLIREELCPNGIWQLTDIVKSLVRYQICRLPEGEVSKIGARYPQSPAEMRTFLINFFTRHYFQTQNSLIGYMISQDFLDIVISGRLQILDVGSGPAVASLAITEMLARIIERLKYMKKWPKGKAIKVTYILNDTSGICLGTGQQMLTDYFRTGRRYNRDIIHNHTVSIQKAFPDNMDQLRRVMSNLGSYDIVVFSYVISPLSEDKGFDNLIEGLSNIEKCCNHDGRILILQDKFQASLVQRMGREITVSSEKQVLTQCVYPKRNENETFTYTYYHCLYEPIRKMTFKQSFVA